MSHDLKNKVLDLENEVLNSNTTEIETRSTIEILEKKGLEQNKMVTALQELVMELCNKKNIYGGSEAYWEVRDECLGCRSIRQHANMLVSLGYLFRVSHLNPLLFCISARLGPHGPQPLLPLFNALAYVLAHALSPYSVCCLLC